MNRLREERRGGAPREHWVSKNRDLLLTQVRNTVDATKTPTLAHKARHLFGTLFPVESLMVTARAFGVFVLVSASVLTGGLVTAQMYGDSIPGDNLYKVKVAVEKLQLALAPTDEYRASLHTEFADRRIDEIAKLAESGKEGEVHLADALVAFEQEVRALESDLETLAASQPAHVAELAKTMERKMAVYQNLLRKAQANVSGELRHAIVATRNRVDNASISAMAVLVEQHLLGDEHAPQAVVISKFEERLLLAERSLPAEEDATGGTAPTKSTRAKTAIAEAKVLIEEANYKAALIKITEIAELTKDEELEEDAATDEEEAIEEDAAAGDAPEGEVEGASDADEGTETPEDDVAEAPVDSSEEGEAANE